MVVTKIIGGLLVIGGLLFVIVFPDIAVYQSKAFSKTGIIIGVFLILLGIYLLRS
jgi:hypothetical protein